jgi:hypothetical protein
MIRQDAISSYDCARSNDPHQPRPAVVIANDLRNDFGKLPSTTMTSLAKALNKGYLNEHQLIA